MDRLTLLKSLAPGFLPLLVFIVADSIWGVKVGLIVAVVFGIAEFLISYLKEKIIDKFILLDIGLIVMLGLVSILLDNPIFFKLKPALIELIFCFILGFSAFSRVNIMLLMTKRYMKDFKFDAAQTKQMSKSLKAMFFIFLAHTAMIIYSAFFMSKQAWAFISGGLFYILFAVYLAYEFIRNRAKRKKWTAAYQDEEWFDLVDPEGRVTGRVPRSIAHSGPGKLHPVVHIQIMDSRDRIFLQKRAQIKQIQPGKWDTAVGGHVSSGEDIKNALKREAAEEIGITDFKVSLVARYVWETQVESELVFMFLSRYNGAFTINRDEIDEARFWKIKKIKENLGKGIFTPNFEHEFEILKKNKFQ